MLIKLVIFLVHNPTIGYVTYTFDHAYFMFHITLFLEFLYLFAALGGHEGGCDRKLKIFPGQWLPEWRYGFLHGTFTTWTNMDMNWTFTNNWGSVDVSQG